MRYTPVTEPVVTLLPGERFVTTDSDGECRHYLVMSTGLVRMLPRVAHTERQPPLQQAPIPWAQQ